MNGLDGALVEIIEQIQEQFTARLHYSTARTPQPEGNEEHRKGVDYGKIMMQGDGDVGG